MERNPTLEEGRVGELHTAWACGLLTDEEMDAIDQAMEMHFGPITTAATQDQ